MFTYNTNLEPIKLRAYGRHIQALIAKVKEVSKKEERTQYVESIIQLMKKIDGGVDLKEERNAQIWNDLFVIADYDLDVDSPYPKPTIDDKKKPQPIYYQPRIREYKCSGRYLVGFIKEIGKTIGKDSAEDDKLVPMLIKWVSFHKKEDPYNLLHHIETIMGKKVTITPHIEAFLNKRIFEKRKNNNSFRNKRKHS